VERRSDIDKHINTIGFHMDNKRYCPRIA